MTVDTTDNTKTYTGDNSTDVFSFPYLVYQASHVSITLDGVASSAWSATGYGDAAGISITFDSPPATDVAIVIQRIVPYTQETDLENFDGNPSDVTEKEFDLLAMADQQLAEQIDRSILTPIGTTITTNTISGTIDTTTRALTITTSGIATADLADLVSDIDIVTTSLATGDILQYDGSNFVNVVPATFISNELDDGLASIASLTTAADKMIYTTALDTYAVTDLSAFGRSLIDDANAAAAQATLGLVIGTNVQAYDAELAAIAGLTSAANKIPYFTGSGTASMFDFVDEDTMSSDSATALASQQSIKAYVDTQVAGATSTTFGAVGTYLLAKLVSGTVSSGATVSGASIDPLSFDNSDGSEVAGTSPSGTWRNMGADLTASNDDVTLFVRTV